MNARQIRTIINSNQKELRLSPKNYTGDSQYRLNPIHVLGIPFTTASMQELWQAEKVLSLGRLNVLPQKREHVSGQPDKCKIEIKQEAQKLEKPLQKVVEQLFEFDFERNPMGAILFEEFLQISLQKLFDDTKSWRGLLAERYNLKESNLTKDALKNTFAKTGD